MQDALKYYHAGMIALKLNQSDRARDALQKALKINPEFSILYSAQAQQALKQLQ
jgi:Tfp pilus assembly protein PilF